MTTHTLAVTRLTTGYPRRPVLDALTLAPFAGGHLTALVGPNGAGKSTLLRAVAGLLPVTGAITLDGRDLTAERRAGRATTIGFMPQALPQRVGLTVIESVISALRATPAERLTHTAPRAERRALEVLERLEIADLAMRALDQLSGGQRQLVSLAQTIARDPDVLLLDEPTSSLDLGHQVAVMTLVDRLAAEGRVVVAVMHDLTLAARWAQRVVVLARGTAYADGPADVALAPDVLRAVYGVETRLERCSRGFLHVAVDRVVPHG